MKPSVAARTAIWHRHLITSTPTYVPAGQATARFYVACVTSATVHLHEEGYIHRNVTPHSVYITDNGYAQLADLTCAAKIEGSKVRARRGVTAGRI